MFNLLSLFNKLLFNRKQISQVGDPPVITITNFTKSKISSINGMNVCTVTFQSSQPLLQWESRADGNGYGSGDLVGIGGSVLANTDTSFDVENNELMWGDKEYRINIYGKNASGVWSVYE